MSTKRYTLRGHAVGANLAWVASGDIAISEILAQLQLSYDAEYAMAEQLYTATP